MATTGEALLITNAYDDPRFDASMDAKTGYKTRDVLCVPILVAGEVSGVVQLLNKRDGAFGATDLSLAEVRKRGCGRRGEEVWRPDAMA